MQDLTGKVDSAGPPTGQLQAAEWNEVAEELKNLAYYSGVTLSGADLEQLARSVAHQAGIGDYYTATGTANAQILTSVGRHGAQFYPTGLRVRWKPSVTNTGAATLNVNSLGVKSITRNDFTVLQAGDITQNRYAEAVYDGVAFRLLNSSLGAPAQALPSGYITGLILGRNSADPSHDLVVSVGSCRDSSNTVNLVLSSALTKQFDGASIALGTGQTGFPTVSLSRSAATWYRVFIVGHVDGRTDIGFDTVAHADASALRADLVSIDSAGWNYYRQLGWVRTQSGSSTAFIPMSHNAAQPNQFNWAETDTRIDANHDLDGLLTRQVLSLAAVCPPGAVATVEVFIEDHSGTGTTSRYALLTDKGQADYTPSATNHTIATRTAPGSSQDSWTMAGAVDVEVDASSEIYERWSGGGAIERTIQVPRFHFAR